MIKKISYILLPACMTLSVAMAEPLTSNSVLLSSEQMDQVTAGLSSTAYAGAIGVSNYLAFTKVNVVSMTQATGGGNSGLAGGATASGGEALAAAVGPGAATGTIVTATTDLSGSSVTSQQHNAYMAGPLGEMNGSAVVAVSAPTVSPF